MREVVRSPRRMLVLVLLMGLGGCATQGSKQTFRPTLDQARLVVLMEQRLELAKRVAWIKYGDNKPVKDRKREAELLATLVQKGQAVGLPEEAVRKFFGAQIEASCEVQAHLIRVWQRGATLPTYPPEDLKKDIRPKLDVISTEMLARLRAVERQANAGLPSYAWRELRQAGYSWRVAGLAAAPLN